MYQVLHWGLHVPYVDHCWRPQSRFRSSTRCRGTTHLGKRNAPHLVPQVVVIDCGPAVEAVPVYAPFHVWLCLLEQIVRDSFNDSRPAESLCLATYPNEECATVVQFWNVSVSEVFIPPPGFRHHYIMLSYSRDFRFEFADLTADSQRPSTSAEAVDAAINSWSGTPSTPHLPPSTLPIPLQRVWDESGHSILLQMQLSPWIPSTIFAWRSPIEKIRRAPIFALLYHDWSITRRFFNLASWLLSKLSISQRRCLFIFYKILPGII